MSIIFQLFHAEDLQRLSLEELEELRQTIIKALGNAQSLSLKLTRKTQPDPLLNRQRQEALNKQLNERFDEVSHQLKSPQLNPPQQTFNFDYRIEQRNAETTRDKEKLILEWAITCEINNFEFYSRLLEVKEKAYDFFENKIKANMKARGEEVPDKVRLKAPDSSYSPLNPRNPLSGLFYDLSRPESYPS
jgi:wobble nucleotide-excising tRNase